MHRWEAFVLGIIIGIVFCIVLMARIRIPGVIE